MPTTVLSAGPPPANEWKGGGEVVDACFRPGAFQGGGVEEGKDALSRLKEKIKNNLLN